LNKLAKTSTVRPITAADHAAWLPLWQGYVAFYESTVTQAQTALTWQRLLDPAFNLNGLVAEQGGVIVGFTHYLFHPATWAVGDYCYLEDLFVNPAVRGGGAGRALIEGVKHVALAKGAAKLYWLTQTHNTTARILYDAVATDTGFMHYQISL
jgi:GNAT superfamily N-acetyltransferase